jgi:hypothetical protein
MPGNGVRQAWHAVAGWGVSVPQLEQSIENAVGSSALSPQSPAR